MKIKILKTGEIVEAIIGKYKDRANYYEESSGSFITVVNFPEIKSNDFEIIEEQKPIENNNQEFDMNKVILEWIEKHVAKVEFK